MKALVLIILTVFNGINIVNAANEINQEDYYGGGNSPQVINFSDSIYFDLSAAVVNGNTVEFPVYLRSDDVINALDFAFKYDHSKLDYDTTIVIENYIDAVCFYNLNDSTVRLTSYCFTQAYDNDSILFKVKFTVLSGQICSGDLNSVEAWLNGDACTGNVVECLNSGIDDTESESIVAIYPNPASEFVNIEFEKADKVEIIDIAGKVVYTESILASKHFAIIDISRLNSGIYFTRCYNGYSVNTGKLLVK